MCEPFKLEKMGKDAKKRWQMYRKSVLSQEFLVVRGFKLAYLPTAKLRKTEKHPTGQSQITKK
jgi:hypothetical protein